MKRRLAALWLGVLALAAGISCSGATIEKVVVETARKAELTSYAADLAKELDKPLVYADTASPKAFNLGGAAFAGKLSGVELPAKLPEGAWQWLGETPDGSVAAAGNDTFSIIHAALEMQDHLRWGSKPAKNFRTPTFRRFDNIFDDYAVGFNRTADNFDLETHIRDTARTGLQTFEVNRLFEAIPIQVKTRRAYRDKYQWWCFYSATFDMFVESTLNRGSYPDEMLRGNLAELKKCVKLVRKYGMKPVIQVFEPRVWPETLFDKYPELRGARVDLATYSGEAEYGPDVNHPLVKQHYRELAENLLKEVPDLDLIEVWSNDSNAGVAWSNRLYMGPNGPIFSREKPVEESVISLLSAIRDGAHKVNPDCRIGIDLSWFFGGRIPEGADRLAEAKTILKALPPEFDAAATQGTSRDTGELHAEFADWARKELKREIRILSQEVSNPWKPVGPFQGLPYPAAAADKLNALKARNTLDFTNRGGLTTATFVPNFINNEVIRSFQYDGDKFDLEKLLAHRAEAWTDTPEQAALLRKLWAAGDDIYRNYDNSGIVWTSHFFVSGRTLFRHLVSPLVPNPYLLDYEDTAYYRPMEFHVGESDPSWFDISYYGFGQRIADDMMKDLARRLGILIAKTDAMLKLGEGVKDPGAAAKDILGRMKVFRCMLETDRLAFLHQEAVHRYLKSGDAKVRAEIRGYELAEIENVKRFIDALNAFDGVVIPETSGEDNVYVIRAPITHQLKQKLRVMQKHLNDEPGPVIEGNYVKSATR